MPYLTRGAKLKSEDLTVDQKIQLVRIFQGYTGSKRQYCREKNVHYGTFCRWEEKFKIMEETSINQFHDKGGRPRIFSEKAKEDIVTGMILETSKQNTPSKRKYRKICQNAILADKRRRNQAPVAAEPSPSTLRRLRRNIEAELAQMTEQEKKARTEPKSSRKKTTKAQEDN